MHFYYISYVPTAVPGLQIRTAEVRWSAPLTTMTDVNDVARMLAAEVYGPVVVVSFTLLRVESIGV